MKALTLTQPWATLIAIGSKCIETRSWSTPYRGRIAIHAAKGLGPVGGKSGLRDQCKQPAFSAELGTVIGYQQIDMSALPLGAIVAIARLVACVSTNFPASFGFDNTYKRPARDTFEYAFGDYSPNRFMWFLEDVIALPVPIPCKGALSLWDVPSEIDAKLIGLASARNGNLDDPLRSSGFALT